ncbi:hypothetical protein ACH4F6_33840 [Streptomyces sp. NPDC017936]|uniref:hypothetical protein n=1 Tax=Streptomyces sp. NPDC017936 TaxID=3365016 RepID=UPI0037AE8E53
MSRPLPQLPKPEFVLIPIEARPEMPTQIAVDLGETGIPGGLIGYEYRPLSEPVYFGGIGERGLVAIATSGLFGHVGRRRGQWSRGADSQGRVSDGQSRVTGSHRSGSIMWLSA